MRCKRTARGELRKPFQSPFFASLRIVKIKAYETKLVKPDCSWSKCGECQLHQGLLVHLMRRARTGGWTGRGRTLHRTQRRYAGQSLQLRRQKIQRSHVGRLFLHPQELTRISMMRKRGLQFGFRQRKELFQEDDRGPGIATALAFAAQLMADFSRTDDDALRVRNLMVLNYRMEASARQFTERTGRVRMPQH